MMTRQRHRRHHGIRTNHNHAGDILEVNGHITQITTAVGNHGFHNIAVKTFILSAGGGKNTFITAPDHHIGRFQNLFLFVAAVLSAIARKIKHTTIVSAQSLRNGKQHRIAQSAAHQQHRLIVRNFCGSARGSHQNHIIPRFEGAAQVR